MTFSKIIIYGHKSELNTFHWVMKSYYRAFQHLAFETLWLDHTSDISNLNFDNCLFLTEGNVDKNIPLIKSAKYIIHNCDPNKYLDVSHLNLQFFHNGIEKIKPKEQHWTYAATSPITKINNYTWLSKEVLWQPWGTDRLDHEINLSDAHNELNNKECVWIGTYGGGDTLFENHSELDPFFKKAKEYGLKITKIDPWYKPVSSEENQRIVNKAFVAPSILGKYQVKTGYLSCRSFKGISYGHLGITNSSAVNDLFNGRLVYDSDTSKLFDKVIEKKNQPNVIKEIKDLMQEVKDKHTYINRAKQILEVI